jgi:hypothetical protein
VADGAADLAPYVAEHAPPADAIVPPGAELWWRCWQDVQGDRPIGMDVGPVPWSVVDRWAARHGVSDFDALWTVTQRLDDVWMEWRREQRKKDG